MVEMMKLKLAMTIKKPKSAMCPACGEGQLVYGPRDGRTFEYKGFQYPIPTSMALVECTVCHEMPITPAEIEAIERLICSFKINGGNDET